jgi:hypothetical protein
MRAGLTGCVEVFCEACEGVEDAPIGACECACHGTYADPDLELECVICHKKAMEGYFAGGIDNRAFFYCSLNPCLASDGNLTPQQALTAYPTVNDLGDDE